MKVKPVDVFDNQGNLTHIEFLDISNDEFICIYKNTG
jgi:hypothetical protein